MLNGSLYDDTFKDLRDYIYDHSGIYINDNKKYLIENRLSRIIQEYRLTSYEDYLHRIKNRGNGVDLNRLMDAVTTNETYFFREPQQFEMIVKQLVPEILKKNNRPKVKIWSMACSTGEEPYTISMMLMENKINVRNIEIYGSDISEAVLSSARRARYNSYAIRNVPDQYLNKYFTTDGKTYALNSSVKNSVDFRNINVIDDKKMRYVKDIDIILCRNVLIYFDIKAKQKAVSEIYDSLIPGGYLFLGTSESLHSVTRAFRPSVNNRVITYIKE